MNDLERALKTLKDNCKKNKCKGCVFYNGMCILPVSIPSEWSYPKEREVKLNEHNRVYPDGQG